MAQNAGPSPNTVVTAIAEKREQVQLIQQKQAEIENLYAEFVVDRESNTRSGVVSGSDGPALEGLSRRIQTIRGMMEKLLAPPPTANNFATPGSSRFDRKPIINYNNIPDQDPTPQITLKDAIETVPNFNGYNISVLQFARACNRAKALIPSQAEPQLARLLTNKLQDHACLAVEDRVFDSVNDLIKQLKRTFSPAKTSDHYRGELANIIKGPNEHVLEYISRVKDLRFAILEEDREYYRDFARNHPDDLDRLTLDSFVDGLPPHMRTRLFQHNFETLDEAFDLAVLVDKKIERDHQRFSEQEAPKLICQICNKTGHDALSCRSNKKIASQPSERYPQNRVAGYGNQAPNPLLPYWDKTRPPPSRPTEVRICDYCKKPGHAISECRKRILPNHRDPRTLWEMESESTPSGTDGYEQWSGPNRSAPTYDLTEDTSNTVKTGIIQIKKIGQAPSVRIHSPDVRKTADVMINTSTGVNVPKFQDINPTQVLLSGTSLDPVSTLGTIRVLPKETKTSKCVTPIPALTKIKSLLPQDPSIHHIEASVKVHSLPSLLHYAKSTLPIKPHESLAVTLKPDRQKIHAVLNYSAPCTPEGIKNCLGLSRYYMTFIPELSETARPLTSLRKKDTPFDWRSSQQTASNHLKSALPKVPISQCPNFEMEFRVTTDAHKNAIGGILSQKVVRKTLPITYTPCILNNEKILQKSISEKHPNPGKSDKVTENSPRKPPVSGKCSKRPREKSDDDLEDRSKHKPSSSKRPRFSSSPIHVATSESNPVDPAIPTSNAHLRKESKRIKLHRKMRRKISPVEIPLRFPPENIRERLPITKANNTYKLPIQGLFVKYLVCVFLSLLTLIKTADVFIKNFIYHFGALRAILTDQAAQNTRNFTKAVPRECKMQQFRTRDFHPQTNGSLERLHLIVTECLKLLIGRYSDWYEWINLSAFSYNTGVHEGTGYTKHELFFAKFAIPSRTPVLEVNENETYLGCLSKLSKKLRNKRHYDHPAHVRESPG